MSTEVVDQAVIGRRKMLLPGEASKVKTLEESAEAIVGFGNEPSSKRRRTHRKAEGPNIKMFQIRLGSPLYGRSLYLGGMAMMEVYPPAFRLFLNLSSL